MASFGDFGASPLYFRFCFRRGCPSRRMLPFRSAPRMKVYARAGGGVFFLDLPESSPFVETNSREEAIDFLGHYDASRLRGGVRLRMEGSSGRLRCGVDPAAGAAGYALGSPRRGAPPLRRS